MPSVTLSSVGTSTVIVTDYLGAKTTSIQATFSTSTSSAFAQIQGTLDDPMKTTSPTWFLISTTTFTSSTNFDIPAMISVLSPIGGVRLNSTKLSAGSITLQVLQNAGG